MQTILKLQNENFPYERPIVNNLENTNKKSNIYMLILTLFLKKIGLEQRILISIYTLLALFIVTESL